MASTRKTRVPMVELIRLINECRQSGMTDTDWCRENDIAVSTFYNWDRRCRKVAADQVLAANYGHLKVPCPKQDVVPIDIVPDHIRNTISSSLYAFSLPFGDGDRVSSVPNHTFHTYRFLYTEGFFRAAFQFLHTFHGFRPYAQGSTSLCSLSKPF